MDAFSSYSQANFSLFFSAEYPGVGARTSTNFNFVRHTVCVNSKKPPKYFKCAGYLKRWKGRKAQFHDILVAVDVDIFPQQVHWLLSDQQGIELASVAPGFYTKEGNQVNSFRAPIEEPLKITLFDTKNDGISYCRYKCYISVYRGSSRTRDNLVATKEINEFREYMSIDFEISEALSAAPSLRPSVLVPPSATPSLQPSVHAAPSVAPSLKPSNKPTLPTPNPTFKPSLDPTPPPSDRPTQLPSKTPSVGPTRLPSAAPSMAPSSSPSLVPSLLPSHVPTLSAAPTDSQMPSQLPTLSSIPSTSPSLSQNPSTSNSPSSSFRPSMSPTNQFGLQIAKYSCPNLFSPEDPCDDSPDCTFFVSEQHGKREKCLWLAGRPEMQAFLCREGQEARIACPETCRVCSDNCFDTSQHFDVDGIQRKCHWLSLRSELHERVCNSVASTACPETCNKCRPPISEVQLLPGLETCAFSINPKDPCDDNKVCTFFVSEEHGKREKCEWLRDRPNLQPSLCAPGQQARHVCPETCGVCTDACDDDLLATFTAMDGSTRDCHWLSLRPHLMGDLCYEGNEVAQLCPESCDLCM